MASPEPGLFSEATRRYALGAATWYGYDQLAVMLAIGTTVLLYFKAQLRGIATRLEARDWISMLQFGVLSLVILPILPDREYGPYDALNPHQIWLMVVLIAGVSLAGYAALQLAGARYGAAFVGVFGGLASSTATTLVYARKARDIADAGRTPPHGLLRRLRHVTSVRFRHVHGHTCRRDHYARPRGGCDGHIVTVTSVGSLSSRAGPARRSPRRRVRLPRSPGTRP